jgi:uncharacterized protein
MEINIVKVINKNNYNLILGQAHFIKTVDDLHELLIQSSTVIKFGIGFCESSGPCLVRYSGNDEELIDLAKENSLNIAAGHSFIIFLRDAYPINVLNAIKMIPEVCRIYCATANSLEVIVFETDQGRGIAGVIDGEKVKGVETEEDIRERKSFLKKIGYKL